MIWNPEYETMPRPRIEEIQLARLKAIIKWTTEKVPYFKKKMKKIGLHPRDIRSLSDITKLPFTDKEDFNKNYPFGLLAVPLDIAVRIHSSSGTKGNPTVVAYTKGDITTWAELTARISVAGGANSSDIAQISFGYGLFTGGFGLHYGLERVGVTVIPLSAGNTERQIKLMKDFGATILISTPSYALYIAEVGKELGIDFSKLPLRIGLFGAEPFSDHMRAEIEKRLCLSATDNYGLTEVMGPGVSGECENKDGLHINEDHFLVEIIDPVTEKVLPLGEEGELVITTLTKEALPVIRYRTRDITRLKKEMCTCGRTFRRMEKVKARTDDMLIIRGVNVYPSQIENVLLEVEGIQPHYQLIIKREGKLDQLQVNVEVSDEIFPDEMKKLVEFEKNIEERLFTTLGLKAQVKLVEPKTIERTTGKAKRVLDYRQKN